MPDYNISVIGAGNVAHHFIYRFLHSGFKIGSVICRSNESKNIILNKFNINASTDIKSIDPESEIILLAINDDSIMRLEIEARNAIVLHTSGSVSMQRLSGYSDNIGVFYPLQTLRKHNFMDTSIKIPILMNASNSGTMDVIKDIASNIHSVTYEIDDEERRNIHLAAVFANNYANHMWHISEYLVKRKGLPFNILHPLIRNTANQVDKYDPSELQTGPALRNDRGTIEEHLKIMSDIPELHDLYVSISNSILKMKKE